MDSSYSPAIQQSCPSMYKALTSLSSSKKPRSPQNVPQLFCMGSSASQPLDHACVPRGILITSASPQAGAHASCTVTCNDLCVMQIAGSFTKRTRIFQNLRPSRSPQPMTSTSWSMSAGVEVASCQMPRLYLTPHTDLFS